MDIDLWNKLISQKDNYYHSIHSATTLKLKKKFIKLFAIYPNDSYTDGLPILGSESRNRNLSGRTETESVSVPDGPADSATT